MVNKKIVVVGIIVILVVVYYFSKNDSYPYQDEISGVPLFSKIPLEKLKEKDKVTVFENKDPAAITCNFEISAISTLDANGYKVYVEEDGMGVYLHSGTAYIKGENSDEILSACHAFSCLLSGVTCPDNFFDIRKALSHDKNLTLVLDMELGQKGVEAYAELLGVLGFIQAKLVDINQDGEISDQEKELNDLFIRAYINDNSSCDLQQFTNLIQEAPLGNETIDCAEIPSGIFLLKSQQAEIKVDGHKVLLLGDENNIYQEAIILRDILSPEWIRVLYQVT